MNNFSELLEEIVPTAIEGTVVRTSGTIVGVENFAVPIGAMVEIERESAKSVMAEVVAFRDNLTLVFPYQNMAGVRHGNRARLVRTTRTVRAGEELLSRVVDAHGQCIDGRPQPVLSERVRIDRRPPRPTERPRIDEPLSTGIRAIDAMLTCGKGQRMGIFAGSGVGKSVALGMMARHTSADVIVVGLIGERGREVNEFIERDLGPEGMAKSVLVVATSDEPALSRVRAAFTATAIAEYFRDQGRDVLLLMDSVTRFAMAQREIGLAAGEPPTTRGYPPSVFSLLPRLVERAGRTSKGSITAFYTVLVEGDDPNEPISDAVRGLLDGHTWLSRKMAARGHYPAIDLLESISRVMPAVTDPLHQQAASILRQLLAAHRDHEDLISIGAYRRGANPVVDAAIEMEQEINDVLRQTVDDASTVATAREALLNLASRFATLTQSQPTPAADTQEEPAVAGAA
jgi:flagellum-specific ATP synthase